ncbi:preprotein translocase subunit SecG [Balneolaceae bacterium YR4-1]|uniref:Protein-export membrane protein SecG n=1 Tax=Halalkalibaculum roseum TaxID=2709311 RepID=A0A6M1TCE2_9BACT|nr:preprotein translocase subunit SecG [Halalkalibaculum roseum]NGP77793.1 preprotein translocase subunit SecG [Halalkalibaculum roseum]
MLYYTILTLIVLICILLTIVILLQPGKGSGLSGGIAGGSLSGGAGLGARRTADLLSKSTTVLGTALLVLCVLANFAIDAGGSTQSAVQQSGVEQPVQDNGGLDNQSQTPSAVPELPQQQNQGSGSDGDASGSDDGGSN